MTENLPAGLTIKKRRPRIVVTENGNARIEASSVEGTFVFTPSGEWCPFYTSEHHYWPTAAEAITAAILAADLPKVGGRRPEITRFKEDGLTYFRVGQVDNPRSYLLDGRWCESAASEWTDASEAYAAIHEAAKRETPQAVECPECRGYGQYEQGTGHANSEGGELTEVVACQKCLGTGAAQPPQGDASPGAGLNSLLQLVLTVCNDRGWSLHWTHRSAYLHLEAAELAEAVRGKRGDKLDEAADVLCTLLALSQCELSRIESRAREKMTAMLTKPPYAGEERTNPQ